MKLGKDVQTSFKEALLLNFKKCLIFFNKKCYNFNAKIMNYEKNICCLVCSVSICL